MIRWLTTYLSCFRKNERDGRRKQAADVLGELRNSRTAIQAFGRRTAEERGRFKDERGEDESIGSKRARLARNFVERWERFSSQSHDNVSYEDSRHVGRDRRDRDREDSEGHIMRDSSRHRSSQRDESRKKPRSNDNSQQSTSVPRSVHLKQSTSGESTQRSEELLSD